MSDAESHSEIKIGSERSFGVTFAVFFLLVALWPLLNRNGVRPVPLGLAFAFFLFAIFRPGVLAPLNRVWFALGMRLANITGPILMGIVYFLVVTPTAFLRRRLGKDTLRLRRDVQASTYWIECAKDTSKRSMRRQF